MTPADRRITELIDKWLASVDLHLKYVELSDATYARAQQWPKHDRPTRWVLEVARQKILELKAQCETRQTMGDGRFAESLELMGFLANLVGIQHIQRFVPLADPIKENTAASMSQTVEAPVVPRPQPARSRPDADDATREMPRLKAAAPAKPAALAKPAAPARSAAPAVARAEPTKVVRQAAEKAEPSPKQVSADLKSKMTADAVRLLKWGKPWHELAELIGRIADRPAVPEIRKFLRANKADIESRAARSD